MIVSRRPQGLVLVRQVDHQEQCASMAEAWGNDEFARIEPFDPIVVAAALHDEGWREWERSPRARDGAPVGFTDIDRPSHVALYRRGIALARARDPRAGLLVSMHGQGLHERRLGLDPGPVPDRRGREPSVRAFLDEQDALQRELRAAIGPGPDLDGWAWAGYRLLQTWDALSIHLTWRGALEGRPLVLPRVPREAGDAGVDVHVIPESGGSCIVSPWPFAAARLELPISARVLEDRPYSTDRDLGASFERARRITLGATLRPG